MPTLAYPFSLCDQRKRFLGTKENAIVLGGPGSGKTTIALLKANEEIASLKARQKILFLSFARATVARVEEQLAAVIPEISKRSIEINTYHGFCWTILNAHGYLLSTKKKKLKLLPPAQANARLADVERGRRRTEKQRLFLEEGLIHFDLFAKLCCELLTRSKSLLDTYSKAFPLIILDEFQDTNEDEWNLIQKLGERSRLIALADIDQRIYEFRGADPARIGQYIERYDPAKFDFGTENNRSNGTDIVQFANDFLAGHHRGKVYKDVSIQLYPFRAGGGTYLNLKFEVISACQRLRKDGDKWSLGILVPTRTLMIGVSDALAASQKISNKTIPALSHSVALEMAGISLAASLIAGVLEGKDNPSLCRDLLLDLCDHIRGRNGDEKATIGSLNTAEKITSYVERGLVRGPKIHNLISECATIIEAYSQISFIGDPAMDWLMIRDALFNASNEFIKQVGIDAQYLRLLRKGALLNSSLSTLWRKNGGNYRGARIMVRDALLREYFSNASQVLQGIHVMTIHRAKGKEFSEAILYEGPNQYRDKFIRANPTLREAEQAKLAFRVGVTRAMKRTTIFSPAYSPSPLL
jgi:DNA helicase II / ATP-dependent DNA helicase PcrA